MQIDCADEHDARILVLESKRPVLIVPMDSAHSERVPAGSQAPVQRPANTAEAD
jgi:hypothetical protein